MGPLAIQTVVQPLAPPPAKKAVSRAKLLANPIHKSMVMKFKTKIIIEDEQLPDRNNQLMLPDDDY